MKKIYLKKLVFYLTQLSIRIDITHKIYDQCQRLAFFVALFIALGMHGCKLLCIIYKYSENWGKPILFSI